MNNIRNNGVSSLRRLAKPDHSFIAEYTNAPKPLLADKLFDKEIKQIVS